MKAVPPIKAVMTPFPYWVDIEESLDRAHAMMRDHGIRHLPVMQRGKLVSVVTDKELASVEAASVRGLSVKDVCRTGPYVVGLSEPLDRVLQHMATHHLDSVLVVKEGKLAGIFTVSDACRQFGRLLRSLFPPGGDDAA
jgi:predicted transcriptional regulator